MFALLNHVCKHLTLNLAAIKGLWFIWSLKDHCLLKETLVFNQHMSLTLTNNWKQELACSAMTNTNLPNPVCGKKSVKCPFICMSSLSVNVDWIEAILLTKTSLCWLWTHLCGCLVYGLDICACLSFYPAWPECKQDALGATNASSPTHPCIFYM